MFWHKIGNSVSDRLFRDSVRDSVIAENQCLYLLRSLIAFLQISENHGLLKRFGTPEVLGIVSSAMSFKMEVNKDMGSSAYAMADCCRRVLHRC